MNIFKNFIPHKTKKFDCKHPEWMSSFIISSLKKTTKYTEKKNIAKMSAKLDNPNTTSKTY